MEEITYLWGREKTPDAPQKGNKHSGIRAETARERAANGARKGCKWRTSAVVERREIGEGSAIEMRFLGNIEARVDSKGRTFLPATFRKELQTVAADALVMRKDVFQNCIVLYPMPVWNERIEALRRGLNRWNAAEQQLYRQFLADVEVVPLDSVGRILLPKRYLAMAAIDRDVRFIGMGDTIEIWSAERAAQPFVSSEQLAEALERIMGGGVDGGSGNE